MNVVFLIFNRPDVTVRVFSQIAEARPDRLFIVADGPRNPEDARLCREARAAVAMIDWPCEVQRNYSTVNLGCRERVISGLDWVFSQVDDAIILEDDCLPHATFFPFCNAMLQRYRDETRVGNVCGTSFHDTPGTKTFSYTFSQYRMIWGWATWRRAWDEFDRDMARWPAMKAAGRHHELFPNPETVYYFEDLWDDVYSGKLNTWGIPWFFTGLALHSLSIVPSVNLISNIGFGESATHTRCVDKRVANTELRKMTFPLRHPACLVRDRHGDDEAPAQLWLPRRRAIQWLGRRWRNRHFYGQCLGRLPIAGRYWRRWRQSRGGAGAGSVS